MQGRLKVVTWETSYASVDVEGPWLCNHFSERNVKRTNPAKDLVRDKRNTRHLETLRIETRHVQKLFAQA